MNLGEIEKGLKAILWGDLGRRAVIEDSAGRGFIVSVGTFVGGNNGVVTEIFEDRLVIQQEIWDAKLKEMTPQNITIKLVKKEKS
jgi:Tfp pilus assembly protein PilP